MDPKYLIYFLLGGAITSAVTYLANNSRGLFAAFIGTLPIISIITFVIIYFNTGQHAVLSFARGLIVMIFPWMAFILSIIYFTPKLNFTYALLIGLSLQLILAFLIMYKFDRLHL